MYQNKLNKDDLINWKSELSKELESLKIRKNQSLTDESRLNNRLNLISRMGFGTTVEKYKSEFGKLIQVEQKRQDELEEKIDDLKLIINAIEAHAE